MTAKLLGKEEAESSDLTLADARPEALASLSESVLGVDVWLGDKF